MKLTDKAKAALKDTTSAELMEHAEEYDGFCITCGEWTGGGCEPDAREYQCEACGRRTVYGAEELIFLII
jgi:hypothetical protein